MKTRACLLPWGRLLSASALFLSSICFPVVTMAAAPDPVDPYLYLEDIDGQASMDWVHAQDAVTVKELEGDPAYQPLHDRLLAIFDSKERIPSINKIGPWYYNFWRDADHVRGIMRRATLDEYRKPDPKWQTIIDLDALSDSEHENWIWKGWNCRYPDYARCIVYLSRGGGDATVAREFDLEQQRFIAPADGGFYLPEAKGTLGWIDDDHVYASTDFGPGTLTDSGYPRIVKRWTRATPLAAATEVFAGDKTDVDVSATRYHVHLGERVVDRTFVTQALTFFTSNTFYLTTTDGHDKLQKLDLPDDATASLWRDQILITLRGAWPAHAHGNGDRAIPSGALLAIGFERFLAGDRDFKMLFTPGPRRSLGQVVDTLDHLLVNAMSDVQNHVVEWSLLDGAWQSKPVDLPRGGTVALAALDSDTSNDYFVYLSNALQPTTLDQVDDATGRRDVLKTLPAFFDTAGMGVEQFEARSADGTMIPYVVVTPKGYQADGQAADDPLRLRRLRDPDAAAGLQRRQRRGLVVARRRLRRRGYPRWGRVRTAVARVRDQVASPTRLRRFHRGRRRPDRAPHHIDAAPRHHGRQQRRSSGRRGRDGASRSLQGRRLPGAATRHATLQQAAGRCVMDGRVRRTPTSPPSGTTSRSIRRIRTCSPTATTRASCSRRRRATIACPSGSCPKDGREDARPEARPALLREHRRRPRRRREQRSSRRGWARSNTRS